MVYISSPLIPTANRQSVMKAQADLATSEVELSSGVYADVGQAIGGRSGQLVSLSREQDRFDAITSTNATVNARLSATSSALDTIRTAASTFLTKLTDASSSGADTSTITTLAQTSLQQMLAALNTTVGGQYIFGGINTDNQPLAAYTDSPPSASKQAVDNAFLAQFGTSQTSAAAGSISGTAMQNFLDSSFASQFSTSGYAATWSSASSQVLSSDIDVGLHANTSVSANEQAFRSLAQAYTMVTEFTGKNLSSTAVSSVLQSAVAITNSAVSDLTSLQAGVGITQSAISQANDNMAAQTDILKTQVSDLDGVDSYALGVKVSSLQTQIQASFELTSKLQSMSLVNYLG